MIRTMRASLLASAAAAVIATAATGARAQGPVEDVSIVGECDAYGNGFFYIPGTDTCLKVGGYVRGELVEGPDFRIRGFAFERGGMLVNPADDFEVDTDGQRFSGGIDIRRIAGLSGGGNILTGLRLSADYIDVEGRAFTGGGGGFNTIEGRAFPNFGIPGVGQDFGVFIPFQTNVISSGSVQVEGWGVQGEVVIDPFAGRQVINLHPTVRTSIFILGGVRAGWTETDVVHTAWANTPLFGNINGNLVRYRTLAESETWVRYGTVVEERSITPYVGLSIHNVVDLTDVTKLHFGIAGRVGPSFTDIEVHDSLRAEGLGGRINLVQDIHLQSDETLTYGSISGMIGISGGPFKISLTGTAEHGLLNQPNLFRADSKEVSPGVFETVPTAHDLEEDWTYSVGLRIGVSLQGLFQSRRQFQ